MLKRCFSSIVNCFKAAGWTSPELNHTGKPEDAFILSPQLLALCDGQSKWRARGVDPGLHSWQLASNLLKSHSALTVKDKINPVAVLQSALNSTDQPGSSTFVFALMHPEKNEIFFSWLGDSGLILLRKEENSIRVVTQTESLMQGEDDPMVVGTQGSELENIQFKSVQVKDKDVILLFTDGVTSNLTMESVVKTVKPFMLLHEIPDLEIVAEMVTEKAQSAYLDLEVEKPFGVAKGKPFEGKNNDATVVIAEINLKSVPV